MIRSKIKKNVLLTAFSLMGIQKIKEKKKPKNKRPPECYTPQEINKILSYISRRCPTGKRNRAAIMLMYGGGLRCQEMVDLMLNDLSLDSGRVVVRNGKGQKYGVCGFPAELSDTIQVWLDERKKLKIPHSAPLICTLQGKKLCTSYFRNYFKNLSKKIEIKSGEKIRVHCHAFRHSLALKLLHEGFNIIQISQQLRHSNVGTTSRYLASIAPAELVNSMFMRKGVL